MRLTDDYQYVSEEEEEEEKQQQFSKKSDKKEPPKKPTKDNASEFNKWVNEKERGIKQPLRDVLKNRCSFFPGYVHIDVNSHTVLEQIYFPGGQQS